MWKKKKDIQSLAVCSSSNILPASRIHIDCISEKICVKTRFRRIVLGIKVSSPKRDVCLNNSHLFFKKNVGYGHFDELIEKTDSAICRGHLQLLDNLPHIDSQISFRLNFSTVRVDGWLKGEMINSWSQNRHLHSFYIGHDEGWRGLFRWWQAWITIVLEGRTAVLIIPGGDGKTGLGSWCNGLLVATCGCI